MLGFERTIVLADNQVADVIHEASITLNFRDIAEVLCEYKVQVAFKRMPKNDRLVIAVLPQ